MKNTLISCIVAILCTIAICVTYAVSTPKKAETAEVNSDYVSESEAAEYIGVTEEIMKIMREKLKYFDGAYMTYMYTDDKGEEVTVVVYNRPALDKVLSKLMGEKNILNFKYLQDLDKAAAEK